MILRGELTDLRVVERSDVGTLHRWLNDPYLMRYWGEPDSAPSVADVQSLISGWRDEAAMIGRPCCLMIEDLMGRAAGWAVLSANDTRHRSAELSFMIGERDRWGNGLGSDALAVIVDTAFHEWNIHRLAVRVEAFNERAARFFERAGFQREGVLRDASYFDGCFQDVLAYSLLASDRSLADDE